MIVSALLTSVGINSGLCVIFFALYSILRKQPGNFIVYLPRLLVEKGIERGHRFRLHLRLHRLIPSPKWLKQAWELSEDELLSISGLDAVVFIRIITFSLRVFSFAGVIGLFILLPINCLGTQLASFDITVISSETLDLFTISNVNDGSKLLWVHCAAVYLVTAFVWYNLYYEYNYISSKRVAFFYSTRPQPNEFTILVRGIPVLPGISISESVDKFFTEYYPSTYLSHVVIRRTNKLRSFLGDMKDYCKGLFHRKSESREKTAASSSYLLPSQGKNDVQMKFRDLESLRAEVSNISLAGREVRSAFVSFRSRYGAAVASSLRLSEKPTEWVAEQAPEPDDVYWPVFHSSFLQRWMSKVVVVVACVLMTVLFVIPVLVVQGLANLSQLEVWFPFLKSILTKKWISQIITGYLPNLILQIFLKSVPSVMLFLSSIQGYISYSDIQKSACDKFLWFIIWNVFFANVLSGSLLNQVSIFLDLGNIPEHLAVAVPAQASFFIAYVVTSGWTSTSSELFLIIPFIISLFQKCCCCCCHRSKRTTIDEFQIPYVDYHKDIPRILFFGLLGITYFFLAPLILPFLLVYLLLAYIVFKNQFINVYAPKFETAGKFWPIVHNSMIFSLVLMHAIAIGIFTLKKVSKASTLIFPLPVLTLLFNEYCRKRFLPNFASYSAESLIKKDRDDSNDPEMPEFFQKLLIAYKDPAIFPVQFSSSNGKSNLDDFISQGHRNLDSHDDYTTPLLSHV